MLLLWSGALLLLHIRHTLICKERRHTLHLQSQSIVPTDRATKVYGFLHTRCVYNRALLFAWVGMDWVLSSISSPHQLEESSTTTCDHASIAATPRLPSIHAAGKYTQVCAKVSQCSSILHSYLSPFEHSLIFQMYAIFAYFLVWSGFGLVLGMFNQMRLRVKFD